jgi:hypothetical protein
VLCVASLIFSLSLGEKTREKRETPMKHTKKRYKMLGNQQNQHKGGPVIYDRDIIYIYIYSSETALNYGLHDYTTLSLFKNKKNKKQEIESMQIEIRARLYIADNFIIALNISKAGRNAEIKDRDVYTYLVHWSVILLCPPLIYFCPVFFRFCCTLGFFSLVEEIRMRATGDDNRI